MRKKTTSPSFFLFKRLLKDMALVTGPQENAAWTALSQWLPPRNPDCDYWWQLTGRHLTKLLQAAGYSTAKQLEALVFHYHYIVPYLGPAPFSPLIWRSFLGVEGSPIEYSWKWNTPGGEPEVRYTIEAIDDFSGTSLDPLNQRSSRELLHRIDKVVPSSNLSMANHFFATLYDHDTSKYVQEAQTGTHHSTTVMIAAEFVREKNEEYMFKTYFIPRLLGQTDGQLPLMKWEDSFATLQPVSGARSRVCDFLTENNVGKSLSPFMLAVDNISPESSRLKWYFQTLSTSFASVREVMTLGGRITVQDSQLQDLRDLIAATLELPANYSDDDEVPALTTYDPLAKENFSEFPSLLSAYLYYFDIPSGADLPAIKIYIPVRRYGRNDLSIAHGVMSWMKARGRGAYCDQFLSVLENISQHRQLDTKTGLQAYVSCLFKKDGELDVTSYVGAEAFDPDRLARNLS
ncbi:dimethylallyl tryptophan synthase GliD1 [Xylaria venustula]|nr:dimethylallyl tryptophan synthase GliD1 [Xylaria venustula]